MKLMRTFRVSGVLIWAINVEREYRAEDGDDASFQFEKDVEQGEFQDSFTSRPQPYSPEVADIEVEMLEGIA
jgi:hypothetical protein